MTTQNSPHHDTAKRRADNLNYCTAQVREHFPDYFLASKYAPKEQVTALIAVLAFAVEIHRIPESVSEELLGTIRQRWWLDALDEIEAGGAVRSHPVVELLNDLLTGHNQKISHLGKFREAVAAISPFLSSSPELSLADYKRAVVQSWSSLFEVVISLADEEEVQGEQGGFLDRYAPLLTVSFLCAAAYQAEQNTGNENKFKSVANAWLARCHQEPELLDVLLEERKSYTRSVKSVPISLMAVFAPCRLAPLYYKAFRCQVDGKAVPFIEPKKRISLFLATLTGKI